MSLIPRKALLRTDSWRKWREQRRKFHLVEIGLIGKVFRENGLSFSSFSLRIDLRFLFLASVLRRPSPLLRLLPVSHIHIVPVQLMNRIATTASLVSFMAVVARLHRANYTVNAFCLMWTNHGREIPNRTNPGRETLTRQLSRGAREWTMGSTTLTHNNCTNIRQERNSAIRHAYMITRVALIQMVGNFAQF